MTRPATLTAAFWLWVLNAAVGIVLGIVIAVTASGTPSVADLSDAERGTAIGILIAFAVFAAVLSLVRVLFAWLMLRPRNWARIVVTVLAALEIVSTLLQAGSAGWLVWVNTIIALVALVLQFLPASNAFFARRAGAAAA